MNLEDENEFQGTKTEIVIRKYGLLAPVEWTEDCESEMRLMDDFWNKLIDVHEKYTSRYLVVIEKDAGFLAAKIEYDNLLSRQAPSAAVATSKRQLAIAQKDATSRMAIELRALETARREEVKIARQNSGLWWGNYNAIVRSSERARSAALRGGNTMRRRSSSDNGRITNTIQGGADVESLYDGSLSQVMVRRPSGRAWSAESRGERRREQRTVLTATVFVRDGERRVVTWPMIMHRPIPPECRLKEVIITRRQVGGRWRWAASFMCTRPAKPLAPVPANSKRLGVDIGWRRIPAGLRVATVLAIGEEPRFVVLPNDLIESFSLIEDLQKRVRSSTIQGLDLLQNADAKAYAQKFRVLLHQYQSIEDKNAAHLKVFCKGAFFLEQQRELIAPDLVAWRIEHLKLSTWLANQSRKCVGRRNHIYHNIAVNLLNDISEIVMNDIKFGEIASRRTAVAEGAFFPNRVHWYRNIAAPSELMRILKLQAARHGITFIKREADSPVRCPGCGSTSRKTRADAILQICTNCGTSFDQDVATCQSLLKATKPARRVSTKTNAGSS
ncbi:transposase [Methylobacterium sp. J-030]|uniref:transposase n=1 Tax=Methylobacterium sp. J-030 TaxID=2836627 RepID=UPI001FB86836|nr:transposase [Methylobacterium sp. J-030]MCJ2072154.1 transposase [Methylobacterium sp. J-030]